LPLPLPPLVMLSHAALLELVQLHPAGEVTFVDPAPPAARTVCAGGVSANVQGAAAWLTVNVCPPIVIVPARVAAFGLAAALKLTVPLPLPLAPAVTVNQPVLLLTAVHEHPVGEVTVVEPVPPAATTDCDVGVNENVHGAAA
jgi:hypothetical protein